VLDLEDRKTLASFFGVDEERLGGPAQSPMDGMIEVPVLDVDASADFGAVASNETSYTRFGFDEKWLRRLTGAKQITIFSDNPACPTWNDVVRERVDVIGRVIWFGRAL